MLECRECGGALRGRSDKRFCDDACRNSYHNRRTQMARREMREIHRKLRRNYRLLQHYDNSGIDRVRLEELLRQGFDPDYCTGIGSARNPDLCGGLSTVHSSTVRGRTRWYKKSGATYRYRLMYTLAFRVEKGEVLISNYGS